MKENKNRGKRETSHFKIHLLSEIYPNTEFKDVQGWQFLPVKAAETLCIVCVPLEEHIS